MSEATKGKPKANRPASETPEVAEKIRAAWTSEMREAARQRGLNYARNPEWRLKIVLSVAGERNPRWEDGRAVIPYAPGFGSKTKELVRDRDGNCCRECGATRHLCVHHSDFSKKNHDLNNLILLCRRCHAREHVRNQKNKNLPN